MEHKVINDTLTIYLKGELNSYTSEEVGKEIEKIISGSTFKKLVLDLKELQYISSAGLRIVIKLKQRFDNTSLVNVPQDVFEIFKMVGFGNLIEIKPLSRE